MLQGETEVSEREQVQSEQKVSSEEETYFSSSLFREKTVLLAVSWPLEESVAVAFLLFPVATTLSLEEDSELSSV